MMKNKNEIESKIKSNKHEIDLCWSSVSRLKDKIQALESEMLSIKKQIASLEDENDSLDTEIKKHEKP